MPPTTTWLVFLPLPPCFPAKQLTACVQVFEYVSGGELFDEIVTRTFYNEKDASECMRQIFDGLMACHKDHIIHRDLKVRFLSRQGCAIPVANICCDCLVACSPRTCSWPAVIRTLLSRYTPYHVLKCLPSYCRSAIPGLSLICGCRSPTLVLPSL